MFYLFKFVIYFSYIFKVLVKNEINLRVNLGNQKSLEIFFLAF